MSQSYGKGPTESVLSDSRHSSHASYSVEVSGPTSQRIRPKGHRCICADARFRLGEGLGAAGLGHACDEFDQLLRLDVGGG